MEEMSRRKYHSLGAELLCEIKNVHAPFDHTKDMHNHTNHEILIVKKGKLNFFTDHAGIELSRGDIALIPMYKFHRGEILTPDEYDRIVINVTENILECASYEQYDLNKCFKPYNDKQIHTVHLNEEELAEIEKYSTTLKDSLFSSTPEAEILTDAYFKLILVMINRKYRKNELSLAEDKMPDIVKRTFNYIDKHLTEEITLKALEDEIHNNGTYISRCVKKISGLSISQYIIAKRIALACRLLREGNTANEACYQSGFNNYSNFSRTFTKQVGVSPKQFQIEYRKGIIANT